MPYPQPYILDLRSAGAPGTGLASQLNAGAYQSALNMTGPAVTANLPTWAESTLIPGLYGCAYDALAHGPLVFGVTLTGLSDPNEATVRLAMLSDPAAVAASQDALANAVPFDASALATAAGLSTLQTAVSGVQTSVSAVVSAVAALPAAELGAAIITIPGDHTTSGNPVTLTHKQVIALEDAVRGGDNTTVGTPAANGTVTVTYYLRGQPKTTGNVAQVSTVTYGAGGQQTGRVDKVASPFPSF